MTLYSLCLFCHKISIVAMSSDVKNIFTCCKERFLVYKIILCVYALVKIQIWELEVVFPSYFKDVLFKKFTHINNYVQIKWQD
jgi:hypothetical protein